MVGRIELGRGTRFYGAMRDVMRPLVTDFEEALCFMREFRHG